MSKVVKGVKKVFKGVGKAVKSVVKGVAKGVRKVVKSKIFKVALMGAAIYFGGAGISSMMSGGSFSTGVGSAWGSLSSAGSSLMSGNFSSALSSIGNAWGTAGAAGAAQANGMIQAGFSAGSGFASAGGGSANAALSVSAGSQQAGYTGDAFSKWTAAQNTTANAANSINAGSSVAGYSGDAMSKWSAAQSAGVTPTASTNAVDATLKATNTITPSAGTSTAINQANQEASQGLMSKAWDSLGTMGKGAVVSSGIQMAGGYFQQRAAEKEAEEELERRRYNMGNKVYSPYQYDIKSAFS